ncbi:MAG TPA: clostripain-related cysteine peptidase [Anaerolineales bacterium]|nr:clostripain-related cysteine peptidase [Anaerolineales bacterium]
MRRIRVTLAILIVFVFVTSLTGGANAAPAPRAKWTVMVYISGDNNLEQYVVSDIETELAATGSSANVQVVALADRAPGYDNSRGDWKTTKLYHVTQGMLANSASAVADWGERNMGDPQTLIDFVTWTKANYPADRYVLYFWGHGWSWHPGWVMEDDTDADTLDYDETKAAIPSLGFIDVVGYDGCNMASIEILKLWHGHATALSGSQEWVGGEGIQYDSVLVQLAANPNMNAEQVAIATSQSATTDKTWSAMAVDNRLTTLLMAVDQWSVALKNGLGPNKKKYDTAFGATRSFWQAPMDKDLYDMAYEIKRNVSDTNIKNKSQAVMDAFATVVLHERHVSQYSEVHGITIYHPSRANQKTDHAYYLTLDLALTTGWDEFLNAYVP